MNNYPTGWIEVAIDELNFYKSQNITPSDFPDEEFELFSVPNFPTGKPEYLFGKDIGSSKQVVSPGDVLLCKINPRINRVWTVSEKTNLRQIASSEWISIRNPLLSANYLKYAFSKKDFRELLCSEVTGVGGSLTRAQPKKVEKYTIPLAPLNEQIRIANKLDSLLAKVDEAQARLEKIPTLLKRFRQSVLAAATSGELTNDWRNTKKIPLNFIQVSFGDLLIELRNGMSPKPNEDGIGYPILRISSVRSGYVDQKDVRYLECSDNDLARYKLMNGDLLFTRYNGSLEFVGVCGLVRGLIHENLLYPDKLIRARLNDRAISNYIEIYFSSPSARTSIKECVKTTSGQKGISGGDIKSQVIALPTIEEQTEIVRRVESLFAQADAVEKQYLAAKQRLDRLSQALLAKAFRGELVPQDPNDEPAAELLKRIQAERQAQTPAKRQRSAPI